MHLRVHPTADLASEAATDLLAAWLTDPATRNVMVAAGNTPIDLYARIARRGLRLGHLQVFTLDEYVGVPASEPRCCAGLLWRTVAEAWGLRPDQFHSIDPDPSRALPSAESLERRIQDLGGLDVVLLGLGQNGHLGFNEPGSQPDSLARLVPLQPVSVEANRTWFSGDYAPEVGITTGLQTILAARHALLLAIGAHKANAVASMTRQPPTSDCPASFLQDHPDAHVFLDTAAAAGLDRTPPLPPPSSPA